MRKDLFEGFTAIATICLSIRPSLSDCPSVCLIATQDLSNASTLLSDVIS